MQEKIIGKRMLVGLFSVMALVGLIVTQTPARASLINASAVLGQLDINGNPSFIQNNADSSIVNDYGFDQTANMAIDSVRHRLFVADTNNNRVLVFNLPSQNIPLDFKLGDFQADYVLGQNNFSDNLPDQGLLTPTDRNLWLPGGLAYDSDADILYVTDRQNARVLAYDVSVINNGEPAVMVIGSSANLELGLYVPTSVALDARNRRLFISDSMHNRVLVYDTKDPKTPIAVLGQSDFTSSDSGTTAANLDYPTALAFNENSNILYVADAGNSRILAFNLDDGIDNGEDAVAVLGQSDFISNSPNTPATASGFFGLSNRVSSMSFDSVANLLYVPISTQNRVMVFDVSTIDNGEDAVNVLGQNNFTSVSANQNSAVGTAGLSEPTGTALSNEYLYVADSGNNRIMIFDLQSIDNGEPAMEVMGQLDGNGVPSFIQNKPNSANINDHGFDYSFNTQGQYGGSDVDTIHHRLFVTDKENNRVLVFNLDGSNNLIDYNADNVLGQADLITGNVNRGGAVSASTLRAPSDLVYDSASNRLYVTDSYNSRVLIYDLNGGINNGQPAIHVLGQMNFSMFGSQINFDATSLGLPTSIVLDPTRSILYVSDIGYNRIVAYDVTTIIDGEGAIAVLGQPDFTSNADALGAVAAANIFSSPLGLAHDSIRQLLYVADANNSRVLVYDVATLTNGEGAVHVLGQPNFTANFPSAGTNNGLAVPTDVAYNKNDNVLYVSDRNNHRVLIFDLVNITDGEAATAVLGQPDFSTNNQSHPSDSTMQMPYGLAFDASNNGLYVTDTGRHRLLHFIDMLGLPSTVLPNGTVGFPYNKIINPAFNNRGTVTYMVGTGNFPPGLSLDPVTRVISGIPGAAGTFNFTITAKDTLPNGEFFTASKQFSIQLAASNGPANLNITSITDNMIDPSVKSQIYGPGVASAQLGKWNIAAANGNVTLQKFTLQAVDPATNMPSAALNTFGTLSLYDGVTLLATANYVNSNVVFSGFNSVIVNGHNNTYTLRGAINASGVMSSNKSVGFVVKSDSMTDIQARDAAGNALTSARINYSAVTSNGPAEFRFARATVYIFHDAIPLISAVSLGNNLRVDSMARIFKFSVTNAGTQNLKLTSMNIALTINGLGQNGTIRDFRLYTENGNGTLSPQIAQDNTVVSNMINSVSLPFNQNNDINNSLDNLFIAPGATKNFVATADTTGMLVGLNSGAVRLQAKIVGSTGWNANWNTWNTGNLFYYYSPANGNQIGAFSASDSYEVMGNALVYTL
jgi:DNA-binding beta-propeller fold protein YncE